MKVVIFSDVHGNLIALEQFVKLTKQIADAYICLGDVVNYGPWNDECLELVTKLPNITFLEGNHEELFTEKTASGNERPLVRLFFNHSKQYFSRVDLISSLPKYIRLDNYYCTHTIDNRSIYEDTLINIEQNFIIGHTHHQYKIERSNYLILNPGSIGQNRKWINLLDYLIFDTVSCEFTFQSAEYNVDKFIAELQTREYPSECIAYYLGKKRY